MHPASNFAIPFFKNDRSDERNEDIPQIIGTARLKLLNVVGVRMFPRHPATVYSALSCHRINETYVQINSKPSVSKFETYL